jgi:urea carboxylase-associated protein 2
VDSVVTTPLQKLDASNLTGHLVDRELPGGAATSLQVKAGRVIRFDATSDRANVSLLLFAADRVDRLNVPDTLKAQMSARIRPPMVLMSDRGTALASMIGSSLDWHDALAGHSTDAHLEAVHGSSSYAADSNGWRRSARAGFLVELGKYGLRDRDLHATVNLFAKVETASDVRGTLTFVPDHAHTGDWVELRAEQDLLLVCSAAPHPLDTSPFWQPGGVHLSVRPGAPWTDDDPSFRFRPESARALLAAREVSA